MFKHLVLVTLVTLATSISSAAPQQAYPTAPDDNLTPGELCSRPSELRYAEKIKYCERDVSSGEKKKIFTKYDQIGYRTRSMNRQKFKIDHYIPLCMGGSNSEKNLWPQHESVYSKTDELEFVLCEKMKAGRLLQKSAVEYIVEAKHNLDRAEEILRTVEGL